MPDKGNPMNPLITDTVLSDSRKPVIVALDFADEASTIQFVKLKIPIIAPIPKIPMSLMFHELKASKTVW